MATNVSSSSITIIITTCGVQVFQSKAEEDDRRINQLEKDLKEAREKAEAADATYEEVICEEMVMTLMRMIITDMIKRNNDQVAKKLATCEADLEKAEDRAEVMIVIRFKRGSLPSITITTHPP